MSTLNFSLCFALTRGFLHQIEGPAVDDRGVLPQGNSSLQGPCGVLTRYNWGARTPRRRLWRVLLHFATKLFAHHHPSALLHRTFTTANNVGANAKHQRDGWKLQFVYSRYTVHRHTTDARSDLRNPDSWTSARFHGLSREALSILPSTKHASLHARKNGFRLFEETPLHTAVMRVTLVVADGDYILEAFSTYTAALKIGHWWWIHTTIYDVRWPTSNNGGFTQHRHSTYVDRYSIIEFTY